MRTAATPGAPAGRPVLLARTDAPLDTKTFHARPYEHGKAGNHTGKPPPDSTGQADASYRSPRVRTASNMLPESEAPDD